MNYKHLIFIIFSLVIIFFVLWNSKSKLIEPLENQTEPNVNSSKNSCCGNDPLFLAIKNAGEISLLKDQVKEIGVLKQKLSTLELESQNNAKVAQDIQQEFSGDVTAFQTPDINESSEINQTSETFQPEISETIFSPQESDSLMSENLF